MNCKKTMEDREACKESISLLENQRSKFAAADVVEQIKTHRKKMRELELELAKHEKAESRSKKYHKEKQKKLASGKRQPQQQQLKFVLPNAAPTCPAPANTTRPTGMMEDSSTCTSNYSCTESSESHTGVTKQPLTPANTESSTGMMEDPSTSTSDCNSPENSESHNGVTTQPVNTASNSNDPKPVEQIPGRDFPLGPQ